MVRPVVGLVLNEIEFTYPKGLSKKLKLALNFHLQKELEV